MHKLYPCRYISPARFLFELDNAFTNYLNISSETEKHTKSKENKVFEQSKSSCSSAISTLKGIENKQRLQTLSIDNAWSNKNFPMLQHTSSEVNGYNCYKHFKKYKNKEGNW